MEKRFTVLDIGIRKSLNARSLAPRFPRPPSVCHLAGTSSVPMTMGQRGSDMGMLKRNNRFCDTTRFGQPQIRVYHRKSRGQQSPRYLLKCGCCDEKLEIFYSEDGLEINGVNGAIEDWREILLPLLLIDCREGCLTDLKRAGIGLPTELFPNENIES